MRSTTADAALAVAGNAAAAAASPSRLRIKNVVEAEEPSALVGQRCVVKGWVRTVRAQKKFGFVEVHDGSSFGGLQCVVEGDANRRRVSFVFRRRRSDLRESDSRREEERGCLVAARGSTGASLGRRRALSLSRALRVSCFRSTQLPTF